MNKNICLDIDGVIADIAGGINKSLEKVGIVNYDYSHWLMTEFEDNLSNSVMANSVFWKNLKPFSDSWYQVNDWWANGYDVYLVTSRRSAHSRDVLEKWLDDWKIQYSQFIFSDMGSKSNVIKELDPIFAVEDNHNEMSLLVKNGINSYMRRAWYNSEYWEDFKTIGTLFDLEDKYKLVSSKNK